MHLEIPHNTLSCLFLFCECRNLIAERSRGEPMQSARSKGKRKKADAAPAGCAPCWS
jgi:hypothetical protein